MRAVKSGFVGAKEAAGLCDLLLFHTDPPRLILAELKVDGGKLSFAQQEFLRLASVVAEGSFGPAELYDDRSHRARVSVDGMDVLPQRGYFPRTIGVYVWKPGDEDQLETILRSKIMAA